MGARGTYRISSMAARLGQERAVPGPRRPLLAFGVLSFLALAALPVAAAGPELTQEWRRCRGDEVRSSEVAIQSCTAIIRSGREKGARLAAAYYSRATAHRVDGWYDRAIEDYDQAIRLDPKHAIAYNDRGTAYSSRAQPNRAIQDFDQAIRLNPKLASAFNNRGNAYSSRGELDRAIQDYDHALKLEPKYAFAFNNRGNAYRAKGELDRAIQDFDQAIRLKPRYALAFNNRGNAYSRKGLPVVT